MNQGMILNFFLNTPAYDLAKSVEAEDTNNISKIVLSGGVSIDYLAPKFGNTLLTLAIVNNREMSLKKLLELNADPNTKSSTNSTPFLNACYNISQLRHANDVLLMLIKYGADVNYIQVDSSLNQFGKKSDYKANALGILCVEGNL